LVWLAANDIAQSFLQRVILDAYAYVLSPNNAWHFDSRGQVLIQDILLRETLPVFVPLLVIGGFAAVGLLAAPQPKRLLWIVLLWVLLAVGAGFVGRLLKYAYFMQAVPALTLLVCLAIPLWRRW